MNYIKKAIIFTVSTIFSLSYLSTSFADGTPDGQTPAEETVCDPLKADGITKGLYGLCVAFCEANDIASLDNPITETDLDLLAAEAPSGKILANYNKKKQETDPEMPCILVEEPCSCWFLEDLPAIDGIFRGGEPFDHELYVCRENGSGGALIHEHGFFDGDGQQTPFDQRTASVFHGNGNSWCLYVDRYRPGPVGTPIEPNIVRFTRIPDEEAQVCFDQLVAECFSRNP